MDFNEINKPRIRYPKPVFTNRMKSYVPTTQKQHQEDTKQAPNNPSYWKNSMGVNAHKKEITPVDDNYIEEQIDTIQKEFHHFYKIEPQSTIHKTSLETIASLGKEAVDNYVQLTLLASMYLNDYDNIQDINNLIENIIKLEPNIDEKTFKKAEQIIINLSAYYIPQEKREKLNTIQKVILEEETGSLLTKLNWIEHITSSKYLNFGEELPENKNISRRFLTYSLFMFNFHEESEKKEINNALFSEAEQKLLLKIFNDKSCKKEIWVNFVLKNLSPTVNNKNPKETLINLVKEVQKDKEKVKLFELLINSKMPKSLNVMTIEKELNENIEMKTAIAELLIDLCEKEFRLSIPCNAEELQKLFKTIDISNFMDFKSIAQTEFLTTAIEYATTFINPKTNIFDKNIVEKFNNFRERGIFTSLSKELAVACIDEKNGEYSKVALDAVSIFYPSENETKNGIKSKFEQIKKHLKKENTTPPLKYLNETSFPLLINSLKNKNGEFEEKNLKFLQAVIKANTKENNFYNFISLAQLDSILKSSKNPDGIVDKEKAKISLQIIKETEDLNIATEIIKKLSSFPNNKQSEIFNTCTSMCKDKKIRQKNMIAIMSFCFEKNGNANKNRLEYVKELISTKEIHYGLDFLNLYKEYPQLKTFFINLAKYAYNASDALSPLNELLKTKSDKNNNIEQSYLDKITEYVKLNNDLNKFLELHNACFEEKESGIVVFNDDLFEKSINLIKLERFVCPASSNIDGKLCVDIIKQELDIEQLSFKEKVLLLNSLVEIKKFLEIKEPNNIQSIEKTISEIEESLSVDDISLPVDKKVQNKFISNVLRSEKELTSFEKIMISNITTLEKMKKGIPISYSREAFLADLSQICDTQEKLDILKEKAGISANTTQIGTKIKIQGYNGLLKLCELNTDNPFEKELYDCINRFLYQNRAQTGNKELDEQINTIIKAFPEFINIIGKKQHGTHRYTLDIHSMLVLAHSIENPNYLTELTNVERSILKLSTIFHDIMKHENEIDKGHQKLSSLYTRGIIKKVITNEEIQDRIYEIIDNHHWLEEYSTAHEREKTSRELAFKFRRPNDFEIAKIMANSDLQSVSPEFYERLKYNLDNENIAPIQEKLDVLYSTGNVLFTDKIVSPQKLKNSTQTIGGKEYKIINLHEIDDNEDMMQYGFMSSKAKKDLKLLVHMVEEHNIYNSLNTVKLLSSPLNGGVLSESIITPKYTRTYGNRKYGAVLSQINTNIINTAKSNQGSGYAKEMKNVINSIFNKYSSAARIKFRKELLNNLGIDTNEITDADYAKFYKTYLATLKSENGILNKEEYKIGNHSVLGSELKAAIINYQNSLINEEEEKHNEIVGYTPKIQAVIAKETNPELLPDELLKFANEYDLPIVLI